MKYKSAEVLLNSLQLHLSLCFPYVRALLDILWEALTHLTFPDEIMLYFVLGTQTICLRSTNISHLYSVITDNNTPAIVIFEFIADLLCKPDLLAVRFENQKKQKLAAINIKLDGLQTRVPNVDNNLQFGSLSYSPLDAPQTTTIKDKEKMKDTNASLEGRSSQSCTPKASFVLF